MTGLLCFRPKGRVSTAGDFIFWISLSEALLKQQPSKSQNNNNFLPLDYPMMKLFFVALLPPPDIQAYANEIKQYFAEHYNSRHAQKSPPHITLQPPFAWADHNLSCLEVSLGEFASHQQPLLVTLNGFNAFAPRVIYIDVVRSQELLTVQADLMTHMETTLGIVDKVGKKRPFTPHMTVAFRDLKRRNFKAAWTEFENRQLHFEFTADKLTLLLHDGRQWNIKSEFAFLTSG